MISKNRLKHLKRKCFSVLRQRQSCSHGVKNGCKNLQRFSFKPLKPFCLSSEQGFKDMHTFSVSLWSLDEPGNVKFVMQGYVTKNAMQCYAT